MNKAGGYPWWGVAGAALLVAGFYVLLVDVPALSTAWYLFAWYGYLLVLDALTYRRSSRSILKTFPRDAFAMFLWSVPFWFLFEAYNLTLENWYYVGVPRHLAWRAAFSLAAFATVLPACFFHAEFLRAHGAFAGWISTPLRVTAVLKRALFAAGVLCVVLPLLLPRVCFWLVWGATLFLPELVNYHSGAASLLRDASRGDYRRSARLFFGGLIAGGVWEAFNFGSRCKWLYTVPGFESLKLFEMPLLGFCGFPLFALGAFSFFSLLYFFVRGEGAWEMEDVHFAPPSLLTQGLSVSLAVTLSLVTFLGAQLKTTRSIRPLLEEVSVLAPAEISRLVSCGVRSPEQLERASRDRLAACAGLAVEKISEGKQFAALLLHKGMGPQFAELLWLKGIRDVRELAAEDPAVLALDLELLKERVGSDLRIRPAEVRIWIRSARVWGRSHP